MQDSPLYRQIAEAIQQEILSGDRKPGERLPSVRELAAQWGCTIGTIQHAYGELARRGLVTSRSGQGTRIVERPPLHGEASLRRAMLIHRAEEFLLEVLTSGFQLQEVETAFHVALDRWRTLEQTPLEAEQLGTLRFSGSHDLVLTFLAGHFSEIAPGYTLRLNFSGSLGGLFALAEGKADLAGSHLWDAESNSFNVPFVRRLMPGRRMALVTLAHRRIGLILPEGNPHKISGLIDLTRPNLRFANRQAGSGTRVWLDETLRAQAIPTDRILGYSEGKMTHSAVAHAVAEGSADVGIGLQAAALTYHLDFLHLTQDRYDFVMPAEVYASPPVQALLAWMRQPETLQMIANLGGYDVSHTGQVSWLE